MKFGFFFHAYSFEFHWNIAMRVKHIFLYWLVQFNSVQNKIIIPTFLPSFSYLWMCVFVSVWKCAHMLERKREGEGEIKRDRQTDRVPVEWWNFEKWCALTFCFHCCSCCCCYHCYFCYESSYIFVTMQMRINIFVMVNVCGCTTVHAWVCLCVCMHMYVCVCDCVWVCACVSCMMIGVWENEQQYAWYMQRLLPLIPLLLCQSSCYSYELSAMYYRHLADWNKCYRYCL